ncbi:DUF3581 family protein [Solemya velesiana gill symbiont]|uniref:DUF3581 domain-containing protein n=1 Tax=Solemya velesiana gill symbiont TaxID=1918948 RepID=A0A1T2KV49_9GAMM|nr:DUF3581 family protein [Solemya velesiana gill symbiont]OOZ36729.1 hypothetical protein BOW51_05860 [Solemya velesiana gill symbiont]
MHLNDYFSLNNDRVLFTREQGSRFAKKVAGDFNPLHNPDSKLFCVPGDLLFSVALSKYGVSEHMRVVFSGMVGDGVPLNFPEAQNGNIDIVDDSGKTYLSIERDGNTSTDPQLVETLACNYVQFSGTAFPSVLVPLMKEHGVMINPDRPMVIYQSMEIHLDRLDIQEPILELCDTSLAFNGRKGNICLEFCVRADGELIGKGAKYMALRGLRDFEQDKIQMLVDDYVATKAAYAG